MKIAKNKKNELDELLASYNIQYSIEVIVNIAQLVAKN